MMAIKFTEAISTRGYHAGLSPIKFIFNERYRDADKMYQESLPRFWGSVRPDFLSGCAVFCGILPEKGEVYFYVHSTLYAAKRL